MDIQWYPGHMAKARRQMQEDISLVDLIIEIVDARAPLASRNPDLAGLGPGKARLVLLNKADLADDKANSRWVRWFRDNGVACLSADSRSRAPFKNIEGIVREACREKLERDRRRGIKNRPVKAMVVGIPNAGKSTFINSYAGKASAKTENRPGVTKGRQWISIGRNLILLDTPGVLWPKFDDPKTGERLALIGSVKDEVLNTEELCLKLISYLFNFYNGALEKRYGIEEIPDNAAMLCKIGQERGCIEKGSGVSSEKAALLVLDDFRSGRLGRISLELPPETGVNG